jgi:hypothetical protein
VLPLILALLPTRDRFRAALACRALARAVRPPSEAWADIRLTDAQLCNPATVARLLPSLRLAGRFLKRLYIDYSKNWCGTPTVASVRSVLEVAVPHLEDLELVDFSADELIVRSARDALDSASRLTRLSINNDVAVVAPCRLPGQAWAAAATDEFVHEPDERRLRQAAVIAAAAAPAGARLAKFTRMKRWHPGQVESFDAFAAMAGAGLTHLSVYARPELLPALAAVVARLPALVELAVCSERFEDLDLTALTSPSLERLAVRFRSPRGVQVSDGLTSRLCELVLADLASPGPPAIFRGGGGGRFTRLTRLEYTPFYFSDGVDLGPWSDAEFSLPTLVQLSVMGLVFTLGGRDGRAWAAAVARETLPRLARLEILSSDWSRERPWILKYACRLGTQGWRDVRRDRPVCASCGTEGLCAAGREVERTLWERLPAACAAAGRRLTVKSPPERKTGWHNEVPYLPFCLHFEATPHGGG